MAHDPTTAELVRIELGLQIPTNDSKLLTYVAAANEYVRRYHTDPVDAAGTPIEWPASYRLGAAKLAAGLYKNSNAPGITDNGLGGPVSDTQYRRATDVLIEQLLRIGRFAPPRIG
jgi:hypothetical protein